MEHLKKAQKLFEHVITLDDDLIHDYLQAECADDTDLLNTVLTLVASHQSIDQDTQVSIEPHILKLLATVSDNKSKLQQNTIQFNSDRYQIIKKKKRGF